MDITIFIDDRFRGPPHSGNGGYSAGLFAKHVGNPAEITLLSPITLDKSLTVRYGMGKVFLYDGETLLASGMPSHENIPVIEPPTPEEVKNAEIIPGIMEQTDFSQCFVCGYGRADGLRLFPRRVIGKDCLAALWVPDASFGDDQGFVRDEFVWAALDCPGGWAAIAEKPRLIVLGRITGEIVERVKPGQRCIVAAWAISQSGRKSQAGTAIFTENGRLLARSRTTWIELRPNNPFIS